MASDEVITRLRGLLDEAMATADLEPLSDDVARNAFLPDVVDSVVLIVLIVGIEEHWNITIEDEEISPEIFEDLRSLAEFVERKLAS